MLMPAFELLLPLGALAFYLFDSLLLLYSNELLLQCRGERWRVSTGSNFFLMGRRLWLPDPLQPQRALFRVAWSEADRRAAGETPAELAAFVAGLRPLRYLVLLLLALLIGGLPLAAIVFGAGWVMLGVIALYYLIVLWALAVVYRRRKALLLAARDLWALAFDVLACPPFAVNLVRKLCLRRAIGGNALAFAQRALQPPDFRTLLAGIAATVQGELQGMNVDAARQQGLHDFSDYLQQLQQSVDQLPEQENVACLPTKSP